MDKCFPSCSWGDQYHQEADHRASQYKLLPIIDHHKGCFILPWHPEHASDHPPPSFVPGPASTSSSSMEAMVAVASSSSSHCQAERRRRERINAHLSTLRRLIPSATKLDKASLLGVVIENVKDLKRKAFEIGKGFTIPTDVDEVIVECDSSSSSLMTMKESIIIRVSLCCDERPDLFSDLKQALHGLKLRMVGAEVATLGGRVRNVLILCATSSADHDRSQEHVCLTSLKESVKAVLGRVILSRKPSTESGSNKRQRFFHHFN